MFKGCIIRAHFVTYTFQTRWTICEQKWNHHFHCCIIGLLKWMRKLGYLETGICVSVWRLCYGVKVVFTTRCIPNANRADEKNTSSLKCTPTLRRCLLSLFIEPKKKHHTGQVDPNFSSTVRLRSQILELLWKQDIRLGSQKLTVFIVITDCRGECVVLLCFSYTTY